MIWLQWGFLVVVDAMLCWLLKRIILVGGILYALAMLVAEQIARGLDRLEDRWYRLN